MRWWIPSCFCGGQEGSKVGDQACFHQCERILKVWWAGWASSCWISFSVPISQCDLPSLQRLLASRATASLALHGKIWFSGQLVWAFFPFLFLFFSSFFFSFLFFFFCSFFSYNTKQRLTFPPSPSPSPSPSSLGSGLHPPAPPARAKTRWWAWDRRREAISRSQKRFSGFP